MKTTTLERTKPKYILKNNYTYEEIVMHATEQDRLVTEGTIEKPQRIINSFTPEEKQEFDNGIPIEQYIKTKGIFVL